MANYLSTTRTNYFRVTDEERYQELFEGLTPADDILDFSKEIDGVFYHGFGAYTDIDYRCNTSEENDCDNYGYDFDKFLQELQKILPDDEAFIYFEAGNEKLKYVTGIAIVCTSKEIKSMSLESWAVNQAKELLGEDFTTKTSY